jgi:hypothetical protein
VSDGEDVGTITISDGVNFKTSIEPQSANTNMAELYAGTSYRMNIFVTNTGTVDCTAPTFQLDFGAGLVIEPGWTQVIPITVKCSQMGNENEYEYKKIGVTITDPHSNRNWQDSVSLKFYRGPVTFNIRANREFFGVIIAPSTQAYSFRGDGYYHDEYKYIITMPWVAGDYLAVFSGATAGTETLYSLGINREADSNFHDLSDSANYEPNNTEDTATPIAAQSKIMSYLHKNDIDYYKISLGSSVSVFKPAAMTNFAIKEAANGNGDDKANPRETLYLDIQVKNSGFSGTTSGVIAVLTSASSGYVTIDKNTAEIGDLTVGYYKTLTDNRFGSPFDYSSYLMYTSGLAKAFKFTVLESCPVNTDIPFTVTFTDSGGNSWTDTLTIQAVSMDAHIAITDFAIGRSWDWDDDANPGATPYLDIRVKNTGTSKAHGVNAVLTTASSYVTIDKGTAAIGDLRAGYYKTLTDDSSNNSASFVFIPSLMYHESRLYCAFKFTVSASCPVNTVIPFTVTFTDYLGNTWTDTLTVRVVE